MTCTKCGTERRSLHRDHIVPRCKGGGDEPSNIQLICANCHEDKTREDLRGRRMSDEARAKIGAASRGRRHTAETRARISATRVRLGIGLGRVVSEDARERISASLMGHSVSAHARAAIGAANHRRIKSGKVVA